MALVGDSRSTIEADGTDDRVSTFDVLATPASPSQDGRRGDIQALRAFAVAAVFAYHLAPQWVPGGLVGVDVFFVISGFLVGGALVRESVRTGTVALSRFYARRIRRIVPLASVVIMASVIGSALLTSPLGLVVWGPTPLQPTVTRDALSATLGISNLWFGVSDHGYMAGAFVSPFTHFWSLGIEEQFYVLAPLLIVALFRVPKHRNAGTLALAALCIVSLDAAFFTFSFGSIESFFNPLTRAWELGLGVLAFLAVPWWRRRMASSRLSLVVLASLWLTLAVMSVSVRPGGTWPGPMTLVPTLTTAAILTIGATRSPGSAVSWSPFQWIGDRSYGIYLWHWPVIVIILPALPPSIAPGWLVAIVLTVVLAAVTYRWVEEPFRVWPVRSARDVRKVWTLGGVLAMLAIMVTLAIAQWASSLPINTSRVATPYVAEEVRASGQYFALAVPVNVRPSLDAAAGDQPVSYLDGCDVRAFDGETQPADCVYGTSGPVVVLFGDSHALQWLDALLPATQNGTFQVALMTADGCTPFDPTTVKTAPACEEWQRLAIERIQQLEPALVIASSRVTGAMSIQEGEPDAVAGAIAELQAELGDLPVVWIADTPVHLWVPAECAAENVNDISRCVTRRDIAIEAPIEERLRHAVEANGWRWLDLSDYLCDDHVCGIILGDVLMYRDDDHLSATFAHELSPVLTAHILAALARVP